MVAATIQRPWALAVEFEHLWPAITPEDLTAMHEAAGAARAEIGQPPNSTAFREEPTSA